MKIKMNNTKPTDTLYENAPLHKAVSILLNKHMAALPVISEHGLFVGVIGVNGLLAMLLPQGVRTALAENAEDVPEISAKDSSIEELRRKLVLMSDTTVGKLTKRNVPVIYPDSTVVEVMLLLLRQEDEVAMIDRESNKFICMVSALDLLHTLNDGLGK
jgi:CBS domain-containing protein